MMLTVHNAEIRTATVEIRTLTISGKQVTLAVFRQLRERPWANAFGDRYGEAWGTVNYCPNGQRGCTRDDGWSGAGGHHLHVVWQRGSELFRYAMPAPDSVNRLRSETDDAFIARRDRLEDLWDEARALPQLFIAV
jgi:hypothetical protein